MGYSKGTPDILEAIVSYPELEARVAAVVSIAGAVGGSPLANNATQGQANMLALFPDDECLKGDEGALLSSTLVNKNDFPQEVLLEAVIRFV